MAERVAQIRSGFYRKGAENAEKKDAMHLARTKHSERLKQSIQLNLLSASSAPLP
jgi:hypothetical protein